MTVQFREKTIIITGASAGVCAACDRAFATQKANLVLLARGQPSLDLIKEKLSSQSKAKRIAQEKAVGVSGGAKQNLRR